MTDCIAMHLYIRQHHSHCVVRPLHPMSLHQTSEEFFIADKGPNFMPVQAYMFFMHVNLIFKKLHGRMSENRSELAMS